MLVTTVACAKNGNCSGIQYIDEVIRLSQVGETKPEKLFLLFFHKTKINYNDMIDKKILFIQGKR
jgi:hypothetical protein